MAELKLYIACSLDGKIARADDGIDWLPDIAEEDYGYKEFYDSVDTVIMGYKTYEVCLQLGEWYYKDKISYVFSRNPQKNILPEAELVTDDITTFVAGLKQKGEKDIWLVGGGQIISALHNAGLIDEYIIAIIPIVLGEGVPLFPNVKWEQKLKLGYNKVYKNGVVLLYYKKEKK